MDRPITRKEIKESLSKEKDKILKGYNFLLQSFDENERIGHILRIAYFSICGWKDSISIDVGIPNFCNVNWFVIDGNHRLAAAIFRRDEEMLVNFSGSIEFGKELGLYVEKVTVDRMVELVDTIK